ncbi:hypothetical protein ACFC0N_38795 [Streptomyces zaomyceticus]|uniref:hypothetical protein n=1 Tax=Streptomyces zaomyceticus TaxID=68286 RepID=UPI0035DA5BF7
MSARPWETNQSTLLDVPDDVLLLQEFVLPGVVVNDGLESPRIPQDEHSGIRGDRRRDLGKGLLSGHSFLRSSHARMRTS